MAEVDVETVRKYNLILDEIEAEHIRAYLQNAPTYFPDCPIDVQAKLREVFTVLNDAMKKTYPSLGDII